MASPGGDEVFIFDAQGNHLFTKSALTGSTILTFTYNSADQLLTVKDAYNNTTTITYVANQPTKITSPYGQITLLGTDGFGYLNAVTVPGAGVYAVTNSSYGLMQTFTKPSGEVSSFTYDADGRMTVDSSTAGPSLSLTRGGTSRSNFSVAIVTNLGRSSNLAVSAAPAGTGFNTTRVETTASGLVTTIDDVPQTTRNIASDVDGRSYKSFANDPRFPELKFESSIQKLDPVPLQIAIAKSASLNSADPFDINILTTSVNTNSSATSWVTNYVGSTKKFTTTSPVGRVTTRTVDVNERTTQTRDTSYAVTNYGYDSNGRASTVSQGARTTTFGYNAAGLLSSVTDAASQVASFAYDSAGRVLTRTLPDLRVITYTYDSGGNVSSITPPTSSTHSFVNNLMNFPTTYSSPSLGSGVVNTTYTYSNDRELTQVTRPSGSVIDYNYNLTTGLLTSVASGASTFTLTYASSQLRPYSITSPDNVVTTYVYSADYLTSADYGTGKGKITFTYSNLLKPASFQIGTGTAYTWTYDNDELLKSVGSETLTRNATTGRITDTSIGNGKEVYTYDSTYGELASYQAKYTTSTSKFLESYTRDAIGRIATRTVTIGTASPDVYTYTYDPAGRLTDVAKNSVNTGHYVYDSNSNRTSATLGGVTKSAIYDAQDRLSTYGTKTFGYNLNGERTSQVDSSLTPGTTGYTWDAFGNLKQITLPAGTLIKYQYDGQNRRVTKLTGTTVNERYVYLDQSKLVGVLNSAGSTLMTFFYGVRNTPEYMIKSGTTYKLFVDHVGSVRQVVNTSNGTVAQEITYDEFGRMLSDSSPGFQPFGFAGGVYDSATKLTQFGARWYDADVGRWLSKDPILFDGGDTNLYGYVLQDPVNLIDITGENPVIVGAIIGGVIGAIFTPSTTDVQAPLGDAGTIGVGIAGGAALGASGAVAGSILMAPNANRYVRIGEGKFPEPFSQRISIGGQQGRKIEIGMTPAGKIDFKFGNYRTTIRPGNSCPKD